MSDRSAQDEAVDTGSSASDMPPRAERRPVTRILHGDVFVDDYAWLRDREDPSVPAYLEAENRHAAAQLAPLEPLKARLYEEIRARVQETDLTPPAPWGEWWYATRTMEGAAYPAHVRRAGGPDGAEQLLLDENAVAAGKEYCRVANVLIAPKQQLLAYSTDESGAERFQTRFRDLRSDRDLDDVVPLAHYGGAWSADSGTYFYTVPNAAERPWQVWRHALGAPASTDRLVHQEDDERFYLDLGLTRSGEFVLITAESQTTTEILAIPAAQPDAEPYAVLPRRDEVLYHLDHAGDAFFVVTTDGAAEGRLLRVSLDGTTATELIPERPGIRLRSVDGFAGHVVVWGRQGGLTSATVLWLADATTTELVFDEPVYWIRPERNLEFATRVLRFRFESPITPAIVFEQDLDSGSRRALWQTPVRGGYDRSRYRTAREWAAARDGTRIPVSVVWSSETPVDGTAPLLLYAYGAYEVPIEPDFSIPRLSLLDRGVVYAIAHVRGGGEMGRGWYRAGKLAAKMNSFTDVIDSAEHLVARGYAHLERLAGHGVSAGGLTMGATLTQRPDLFRAVALGVPFVDVINTMIDPALPLTVVEWEEWGDPRRPDQYRWMRAYSPYENATRAAYPALYVTAGLHDPRVGFWEPAKWVARLRSMGTGDRRILLKTRLAAGHFGPSGRYGQWAEAAELMAFLLRELGLATGAAESG
ncbi:MAG: oligopeptidase B [Chloroflexi bacterium]|nr:MAG: oligopeptidase B [Chloroflexota bacterium]